MDEAPLYPAVAVQALPDFQNNTVILTIATAIPQEELERDPEFIQKIFEGLANGPKRT